MLATATPVLAQAHLLRAADLDPGQLTRLLDLAAAMKADPEAYRHAPAGETLAWRSGRPPRAGDPFAAAAAGVGMSVVAAPPGRPVPGRAAAIAVHGAAQPELAELAGSAGVPVINAGGADHDPCEALAGLLTLRERCGPLEGLHVVFAGDGAAGTCHSLIEAGALAWLHVIVVCPPACAPDDEVLDRAAALGAEPRVTSDIEGAVAGAHAVWTGARSVADHAGGARRTAALDRYRVTEALMRTAAGGAVLLDTGADATDQAANRRWVAQAVLHAVCAGRRG